MSRGKGLIVAAVVIFGALAPALLSVLLASARRTSDGVPTFRNYARFLGDAYYLRSLGLTLKISLETTVLALVLGFLIAYFLVRMVRSPLLRRTGYLIVIAPLFTSSIVRSFGWMVALGDNGFVNRTLLALGIVGSPLKLMYNETGIVIGLTHILLPFMVLSIAAVLQSIDRGLEDAASDLGASPFVTFRTVTFPLSLPGVIAGSLIVFTLAVSSYVTPALLSGGRLKVVPMLVFEQYTSTFDTGFGAAMAVILMVITLAIVTVATRLARTA